MVKLGLMNRRVSIMNKLILFCILAIFIFSQRGFTEETKSMKNLQEISSPTGVTIRAELSKESCFALEPIELKITITNTSNNNIFLVLTHEVSPANLKIFNTEIKKEVPLTLYGERLQHLDFYRVISRTLNPSESYKFNILINRVFDLSLASTYELDCEVFYLDDNKNKLSLKTKPLKFSIVEKPH